MARVMIIGGHGKVALLAAPLLAADGHEVTSVIRNPKHAEEVTASGATPLVRDIESLDAGGFDELVAGQDVLVWSAGAGGGNPDRTRAVDRDAAIASMDAAQRQGVRRYVMVSYFGAGPDHGVPEDDGFYAYAEAKSAADEHLRGTDLAWTVLGPSALTLDPGTGLVDDEADEAGSVPRADVAHMIAAAVREDGAVGRTIRFNSGRTPVDEVVRG